MAMVMLSCSGISGGGESSGVGEGIGVISIPSIGVEDFGGGTCADGGVGSGRGSGSATTGGASDIGGVGVFCTVGIGKPP